MCFGWKLAASLGSAMERKGRGLQKRKGTAVVVKWNIYPMVLQAGEPGEDTR